MSKAAEDREEGAIVHTAAIVGFHAYVLSQGYRPEPGGTRQTPGLPDLYLMHARDPITLWWECKTAETLREHHALAAFAHPELAWPKWKVKDWRRARAQADFRSRCHAAGGRCGIGSHKDFLEELIALGYAEHVGTGVTLRAKRLLSS